VSGHCEAKSRINPEKFYRDKYCRGRVEVKLDDNIPHKRPVRCDCLTDSHAIEFDFGNKWAQSVGQSLYYSYLTGKKAGIYLIIERLRDMGYLQRLKGATKEGGVNIDVWVINPNGEVSQVIFDK
jgi:hypothetical protein